MDDLQLDPRALGRGDYPVNSPLKEVYSIAKHCSGGIVLGFEQFYVTAGTVKRGISGQEGKITTKTAKRFPTPWNQLEAGILYGLKVPLLIFKESGIEGGIFGRGSSDIFIQPMPSAQPNESEMHELKDIFLKWDALVRQKYYD